MPSASDIAISIRGLSKSYNIAHQGEKHVTLAEQLLAKARRPFARTPKETFWALKDVEFDIQKGDVVGIIGRNGAGKSTLLKILSRITEPTTGQIDLYGRVGSLLEVGTGFHPELTGRENVFLNGAILGMTKAEIRKQFDAMVDFAGVEKFLDTPVKRYSSGMYVRLAFAVAAHLESEILIVDEVLAVGDAEFQKKCVGKMKDVATSGRAVLFVSHNAEAVVRLCNRCIFLRDGAVAFDGGVTEAFKAYVRASAPAMADASIGRRRAGSGEYRFTRFAADANCVRSGEAMTFSFSVHRTGSNHVPDTFVSCHITNEAGAVICQTDSRLVEFFLVGQEFDARLTTRTPWLKPGMYRIDAFICSSGIVDYLEEACRFEVMPVLPYVGNASADATASGLVLADFQFQLADC